MIKVFFSDRNPLLFYFCCHCCYRLFGDNKTDTFIRLLFKSNRYSFFYCCKSDKRCQDLGVTFLPFFHCFSKFFSSRFCSKKPLKSRILSCVKVWKSLSLSASVFHKLLASVSRNGESHEIFDLNHKRVDGTNSAWYDSQILVRIQFETVIIAIFLPISLVWSLEMITTFGLI